MCKSKNNQLDAQRKSVIIRLKPGKFSIEVQKFEGFQAL